MMIASRSFRQLAQRCDDVERIAIRQHPVDDRQIVLEIAERLVGIRNGCDDVNDPVQRLEQTTEIGPDLRFVFDHKGAHRSSLIWLIDRSYGIAASASLDLTRRSPGSFPLTAIGPANASQ